MPNIGQLKSKAVSKLFDRLMSKMVELWNNKDISSTLVVPVIVRTIIGRKIWNKILGKTNVKKLVNRCGCFKQ